MEFNGKIRNVMPARTGTSQRGNEWKALPFVFEYKEADTDPYPDSVLLETFDEKIIKGIEACCQKDAQGQLMVNNGELMLTRDIYVRISFRHKARVFIPKDGSPSRFINDIRMNNIVFIRPAQQPQQAPFAAPVANQQAAAPFPPQVDANGNPFAQQQGAAEEHDDLPF